jgi:hypothetical protein
MEAATQGFEAVLSEPLASRAQLDRARDGAARAKGEFKASTAAGGPIALVLRQRWGAAPSIPTRMTRTSQDWSRITVHHTAMDSTYLRRAGVDQVGALLQKIQEEHQGTKGWGDIGYHFLIDPEGRVYEGRPLAYQGAHAGNHELNLHNIGVCLLGNFDAEQPTPRALQTLRRFVDELRGRYRIPSNRVYGHSDFKNTACPGHNLLAWVRGYARGAPAASANSSSKSSMDRVGFQPSPASLAGSPTITSGSWARATAGVNRVR